MLELILAYEKVYFIFFSYFSLLEVSMEKLLQPRSKSIYGTYTTPSILSICKEHWNPFQSSEIRSNFLIHHTRKFIFGLRRTCGGLGWPTGLGLFDDTNIWKIVERTRKSTAEPILNTWCRTWAPHNTKFLS